MNKMEVDRQIQEKKEARQNVVKDYFKSRASESADCSTLLLAALINPGYHEIPKEVVQEMVSKCGEPYAMDAINIAMRNQHMISNL